MTETPSLLIATRNPNKRREFATIFDRVFPASWNIMDVSQWHEHLDDVIEDADTFEGNAIKKALETSLLTNMSTMSEDSGLEVDALDGAPGVYSARFAGEHANTDANNALLIKRLHEVEGEPRRSARFVATICLTLCNDPVGQFVLERMGLQWDTLLNGLPMREGEVRIHEQRAIFWLRGHLDGEIIDEPRGTHGFGYDPHFQLPSQGKTLAQLNPEEKNQISHRARALDKLASVLQGDR